MTEESINQLDKIFEKLISDVRHFIKFLFFYQLHVKFKVLFLLTRFSLIIFLFRFDYFYFRMRIKWYLLFIVAFVKFSIKNMQLLLVYVCIIFLLHIFKVASVCIYWISPQEIHMYIHSCIMYVHSVCIYWIPSLDCTTTQKYLSGFPGRSSLYILNKLCKYLKICVWVNN